jgi:hypothetical protein
MGFFPSWFPDAPARILLTLYPESSSVTDHREGRRERREISLYGRHPGESRDPEDVLSSCHHI